MQLDPTENSQKSENRSEAAAESADRTKETAANKRIQNESVGGLSGLVANEKRESSKQKEERGLSLKEQVQKTGSASIGLISKQFKCSVEITDGDNVVVKGRTRGEIIEALKHMEQESNKGMLLAAGGKFVSNEISDPKRELIADASHAASLTTHESEHAQFSASDNLIASKPSDAKLRASSIPNSEQFLKAHPDLAITAADKAILTPQLEELRKKVDADVDKFYKLREWLIEHKAQFGDHLHAATHTKEDSSQDKIQAKFDKLPEEQRKALMVEQGKLTDTNKAYLKLSKEVASDEGQLFSLSARVKFADNLAKLDQNQKPETLKKIYDSISAIMETKHDTHPIPDERRREFAYALVEHISNPGTITQGQKNSCQVADIQRLLIQKDPGFYAEQAAAVVTSGSLLFRGEPGASKTHPKQEPLISPAQINKRDIGNPQRDPLSEVMQIALADKVVKLFDPSAGYQFIDAKPKSAPMVNEGTDIAPKYKESKFGEYVINSAGNSYDYLGADEKQEVKLLQALTGDKYKATSLESINNADELRHLIQKAGKEGYPILLGMTSDTGSHVVAVTNFNSQTGKITVMNSADFRSEKPKEQSLNQLYGWLKQQTELYEKKQQKNNESKAHEIKVKVTAIYETK